METASEKVTDEIQEIVPERHCLETEKHMDGTDSDIGTGIITYSREFLLECFRHPACSRKPLIPLPNLEITLSTARLGSSPFTTLYVTPRRKEESGRREPEDNISLRPHSGNFSSGCAPNLSPAHYPQSSYNRYPFQNEDPSKNIFDRAFPRNNYRFNNSGRPDLNERNRVEREREPRDRDRERETRDNRNARNPNQGRRQTSLLWGPEGENHPEWSRRRTSNDKEFRGRSSFGKYHSSGYHEEDKEPEWFSEGPTSQHDTIELHGFQDDERRDADLTKSMNRVVSSGMADHCSETPTNVSNKNEHKPEEVNNGMNLSAMDLEKILVSDMLPNGLLMDSGVEPEGSSRFTKYFQRNSSPPNPNEDIHRRAAAIPDKSGGEALNLQALFPRKVDAASSSLESKSDVIKGMETELRQILLRSNEKEVPEPPKEQSKQEDLNAFKKLLEDLVIKSNKTASQNIEGSGRPMPAPPPGLHGMQFNPFGLGIAQPRPLQQHNAIAPNISMNQVLQTHSVNRMVEQQQHETPAQSQKRSATPVLSSAFTPTAVMRKMTADQQTKTGSSIVNAKVTAFTGINQQMAAPAPSAFSAIAASASHPNPLSSFMSAVAQNQTSHLSIHQPQQQQNLPQPSHPGHTRPGHVPLPHSGFHPQRIHFPVVVGPPNAGMPGQFPPFMIYPQMPQRK
ncbi:unnamed protein product [Allacma fusca]|uniref:Eukaryotic translation initiation factor 4E transporter n=1 Tax=Allacma fusca TaxID=39272 RepID=A0A8J2LXI5_9HEXA|nr:unnamed protein product [Allacma fusca]